MFHPAASHQVTHLPSLFMHHRQPAAVHHARNTSMPVASGTNVSAVHARHPSVPTRAHHAHPVAIPTPPYLPMPAAKKAADNSAQPSLLAKLAAAATLTLLPNHRPYTSALQFAHKIQRYLNLVRLPPVITHLALLYLYGVADSAFPVECYSIEQLFVTAYALADTHLDDNAYSNKSWLQVLNDGTQMREWHQGEMLFLEQGLNYRLEVTDDEWKRWCNWLCEWWGRIGQQEWKRVEMGKSAVFCMGAPTFTTRPVPVKAAQAATYASPVVHVHAHPHAAAHATAHAAAHAAAVAAVAATTKVKNGRTMESMVGYGVDERKRMTQMAEYEWSPDADEAERPSSVLCYGEVDDDDDDGMVDDEEEEEDDEYDEDQEDEGVMEGEEEEHDAGKARPSLRKSDSGYCGQYTPVPPHLRAVNDAGKECDSDDSFEEYSAGDKQPQNEAESKRASLRWKWTMF